MIDFKPLRYWLRKNKIKYKDYLKSSHWLIIKNKIFLLRGKKCEECDCCYDLNVHHKTYKRVGSELDEDLQLLCRECHKKKHTDDLKAKRSNLSRKVIFCVKCENRLIPKMYGMNKNHMRLYCTTCKERHHRIVKKMRKEKIINAIPIFSPCCNKRVLIVKNKKTPRGYCSNCNRKIAVPQQLIS